MSDLISRQAAIDEIQMLLEQSEDDEHDKTWNNAIIGAVNAVKHHTKSAQPEPKWVPCSERLPEEYGNYLITTYDGNVDIGTIDPKGKSVWSACDADGFYWMRNVIAWMPLPEPWRGEQE